MKALSFYS
jgi:hypothetical protein